MNKIINEAEVLNNWSSIITEATHISDPEKLKWISQLCEFHTDYEKSGISLNESVLGYSHLNPGMTVGGVGQISFPSATANGSGDIPNTSLPLAIQVAAQTIAFDLVPVVPMQGPLGMLRYMDTVYEGGRIKGDITSEAMPAAATAATAPVLVKLDSYTGSDSDYAFESEIEFGEDYKLIYVQNGYYDGKPIYKVLEKDAITGELKIGGEGASQPLSTYASAEGYNFELVKAKEDHVGQFSSKDLYGDTAATENDPYGVTPFEREEAEATPLVTMSTRWYSKEVKAKAVQVAHQLTWESLQFAKAYGQDAIKEAEIALTNELTQTINKIVLKEIWKQADTHAQALNTLGIKTKYEFILEGGSAAAGYEPVVVGQGGETQGSIQRRILSKVLYGSNLIAQRNRLGAATFAVVGVEMATALQDCAGFVAYPLSNTINQTAGNLYPVGQISGVSIYVDPNRQGTKYDNIITLGRKGKADEPGLIFMPWILADKVEVVPSATLGYKAGMKSYFTVEAVGMHPEASFLNIEIKAGTGVVLV